MNLLTNLSPQPTCKSSGNIWAQVMIWGRERGLKIQHSFLLFHDWEQG